MKTYWRTLSLWSRTDTRTSQVGFFLFFISCDVEVVVLQVDAVQSASPHHAGIIYVFSQKDAESLSSELQKRKVLAGCYHANMEAQEKSCIHRKWTTNEIQVFTFKFYSPWPEFDDSQYLYYVCITELESTFPIIRFVFLYFHLGKKATDHHLL